MVWGRDMTTAAGHVQLTYFVDIRKTILLNDMEFDDKVRLLHENQTNKS